MTNSVLFLCTGNATRSVLAGALLADRRPDLRVETGGTLTIDGLPISWRTRAAFDDIGLAPPPHRSRQADAELLAVADLIVALAPEHVGWVRREHPEAAARTGSLIRLARDLGAAERPLGDRVGDLGLADVELEAWEEVVDPGGQEVEAFIACGRQIVGLIDDVAVRF